MGMQTVNDVKLNTGAINDIHGLSEKQRRSKRIPVIILGLLPVAAFILSTVMGRYVISPLQLIDILAGKLLGLPATWPETVETVLFKVRIPRIFAAMLVGAALSAAGAAYQGLFKNPMVSPDILGASAGAGFGAAVAILMSFNIAGIQLTAFIFGLGAVMLTLVISTVMGRGSNAVLALILTGMVVSTLFSSFTSMTKYVADPYSKLPAITFWLMGGLSSITAKDALILLIPICVGITPLFMLRWKLNVLSFGEEEARAMGIDTRRLRFVIIICSTLLTAAAVSVSGMIGWIGLIVPHMARLVTGPDYRVLLPASLFIGSAFLILVDDVARSVFPMEIPLGILTSLLGAPFFIYLLVKGKRGWV